MASNVEPTSHVGVTLDLILKTLIASSDFNILPIKNWEAISRLIPGTTPKQCSRRYDELLASGSGMGFSHFGKAFPVQPQNSNSQISLSGSDNSNKSISSRPGSAVHKGSKEERESGGNKGQAGLKEHIDHGPIMVIHVCDEAKNLKKDFNCPRDLLVREMKYFAEYLTTDAQRWEEVDISVHCDVQIFDWLLKYVKRSLNETSEKPKLGVCYTELEKVRLSTFEPNNVVSILISSDFLKMDILVEECIEYCHKHMSAIVSTNCNMNCINDKLITRITELFNHNEADELKDRKDKFKSKLFSKKLEKLFEPNNFTTDSPENGSTLFRCSICKRLLTVNSECNVKCMPSRMTVDKRGQLIFCHVKDSTFDVNDYLLDLKAHLKFWRDVYWRVWGTINYLSCSRCGEKFPLTEFPHCKYHPESPRYENDLASTNSCVGFYPCCQQKTARFDPTQLNKGCRVKDHIINLTEMTSSGDVEMVKLPQHKVYDDLLAHRDIICVPYQRLSDASGTQLDVFGNEAFVCRTRSSGVKVSLMSSAEDDGKNKSEIKRPQPTLHALTVEREVSFETDEFGFGESDDEIGDEESQKGLGKKTRTTKKSRVTIDPQAILVDAPGFEQTKKSTWDVQRSMRYNQDAQRQEDQRRMNDIRLYLTKLRLNPEKIEKPRKEYSGGVFSKLEAQWKASAVPPATKQVGQPPMRRAASGPLPQRRPISCNIRS